MQVWKLVVIKNDEDHPRAIGAAGHVVLVTHDLDRLAERGARLVAT
jgi:hypothetical protein